MRLTNEQHVTVLAAQGKPVAVVDPQTQQAYVLLAAEQYQRVRALLEEEGAEMPSREAVAMPEAVQFANEVQPMRVKLRDLPMPSEVAEEVKKRCRQLGFWRRKYIQQVQDEFKLQYHFGGKYVAYLATREGPIVVAAGILESEAFDLQLAALSAQERQKVMLTAVDPWNDATSLILSPSMSHEG